jgi:hypothetical protein
MKSVTSLATIFLLIFACRMCSFTGSKSTPEPSSSPTSGSYASDFIKEQQGTFRLIKSYNKEEFRKTASGPTVKLIDQSTDAALGDYKYSNGQSVFLMAASYSTTTLAASLVDEIERDLRADTAWKTVKAIPKQTGKRVEGEDGRGTGLVIWNNGYWVFMTIGDSLSDASSLADNVGY